MAGARLFRCLRHRRSCTPDVMAQKRFPAPDGRGANGHGRLTRVSLDRVREGAFTRRIRQTAQALGVSQHTLERYVSGKLKRPHQDLRGRLEPEVKKRWQPQIRAMARKKGATKDGLVCPPAPASDSKPPAARPTMPGSATLPRPCRRDGWTACSRPADAGANEQAVAEAPKTPRLPLRSCRERGVVHPTRLLARTD